MARKEKRISGQEEQAIDISKVGWLEVIRRITHPEFRYELINYSLEKSGNKAVHLEKLLKVANVFAVGSLESLVKLNTTKPKPTRAAFQTAIYRIGRLLSQRKGDPKREAAKSVVKESLAHSEVKTYYLPLNRVVSETIEKWRDDAYQAKPFDIRKNIDTLYTSLVSAILFGGKQPRNFAEISELVSQYLSDMAGYTLALILDDKMPNSLNFVKKPLQHLIVGNMAEYPEFLEKEQYLVDTIEAFLKEITPEKRDQYGMFGNFLKLADEGVLTMEEVIRELIGMLFAALDTTSRATMYAVARLEENPELFEKLKKEVSEKFGESHRNGSLLLDKKNTESIPALNAFIYATIAGDPPVNIWIRQTTTPLTLDGTKVPKGAMLFVHMGRALNALSKDNTGNFGIDQLLIKNEDGTEELDQEKVKLVKAAWAVSGDEYPCMGYELSLVELRIFLIHFLLEVDSITPSGTRHSQQLAVQIPYYEGGLGPQPVFSLKR